MAEHLTPEQKTAVDMALNGHNFVLTGQAGTGKTHVIQTILGLMTKRGICVNIVCSIGLACNNYHIRYEAKTLHSWAGLKDCRYNKKQLVGLINGDERYEKVLARIRSTQVLIIDEVSMISAKLLSDLEYIIRCVRGEEAWFGGTQVILCGDFYQLPPVPNVSSGDDGSFAFQWEPFMEAFPHRMNLTLVIRQDEQDLVLAVQELSRGNISQSTHDLMKQLSRPLQPGKKPLMLHSRNIDVEMANARSLQCFDGIGKTYTCLEEKGCTSSLRRIGAQRNLTLKVNGIIFNSEKLFKIVICEASFI